jgi:hypothetical protein
MQWKEIVTNNKKSLQILGYTQDGCIDLIKEIEKLNDDEEARIICNEKIFAWLFNNNYNFIGRRFKRLGMHLVYVNEKMIKRYSKYFNMKENEPFILICSSEFGTVGIIRC